MKAKSPEISNQDSALIYVSEAVKSDRQVSLCTISQYFIASLVHIAPEPVLSTLVRSSDSVAPKWSVFRADDGNSEADLQCQMTMTSTVS